MASSVRFTSRQRTRGRHSGAAPRSKTTSSNHTPRFAHRGAMSFSPTNLAKTTAAIFLTRWITHFCMPVFIFTAGVSAFLWWRHSGRSKSELVRFLLTRGLWFIFLELTVMQLAYNFNSSSKNLILLLVLWIFGLCMIAMCALVYLPLRVLAAVSLATIALHNCFDRSPLPVWLFLHQPGVFEIAGRRVLASYPLIPWLAVMAIGFCFGQILLFGADRRHTLMLRTGSLRIAAFLSCVRSISTAILLRTAAAFFHS